MPIKSLNMKISKNKKMRFFLMSQGSFDQIIRFLGLKMSSVARGQTDRRTDRRTDRITDICDSRVAFATEKFLVFVGKTVTMKKVG